ncbi:MAG: phosphoribosylaminoimidazolecarboxamide formyltransferase [Candidatus Dormibacteraeota bacterium]|nr:phosphoribosylaminoimidazolecarboxamide formyltransferase [Candidatus Dormibacteraeota bacterium]MBO0746677.1 phosphoribosylaminoimidazolecarboxamide formyltransferase [Candidatus Dormibacteraeota bacterium]
MELRYGLNPQQPASVEPVIPDRWPFTVRNGRPGYINLLDALNAWQLVRQASRALGKPAATSFKHVSPAGAAVAGPIDAVTADLYDLDPARLTPLTSAYVRARDADPKSSYGDFIALSEPVDEQLAGVLARVVSDGIIAPAYEPRALETLSRKKRGGFLVLEADPTYEPPAEEVREVYGLRFGQARDVVEIGPGVLTDPLGPPLSPQAADDLLLGLVVLRFTQSNSTCYVREGQALGIGAGQQSRVDCTRLAGQKVDTWWLRRHPLVRGLAFKSGVRKQDRINWQVRFIEGDLTRDERTSFGAALERAPERELGAEERRAWVARLTGVAFASDGFLPFRDNVDQAARHGVVAIAEPGGSVRSEDILAACQEHGITLVRTGLRLFHH